MKTSSFGFALLIVALLLSNSAVLHAEIFGVDSVEWITCTSKIVAVGTIKTVVNVVGPGDVVYRDCVLDVDEMILGRPAKTVSFTFRSMEGRDPPDGIEKWRDTHTQIIVFLSVSKNNGSEQRMDGLLEPTSSYYPLSLVDLKAPEKYLMDGKVRVLKTKEEILEVARRSSKEFKIYSDKHPGAELTPRKIEPDFGEAFRILWHGSYCFVRVPEFMYPNAPVGAKTHDGKTP